MNTNKLETEPGSSPLLNGLIYLHSGFLRNDLFVDIEPWRIHHS